MSEFELNIQSQPLFTVSVSTETDQTPYSVEIDTSDISVFTIAIGEMGTGGVSIPGPQGPMGPPGPAGAVPSWPALCRFAGLIIAPPLARGARHERTKTACPRRESRVGDRHRHSRHSRTTTGRPGRGGGIRRAWVGLCRRSGAVVRLQKRKAPTCGG